MTQDQFQVLRSEMKDMEVRLRDHSFNGHKSIWSNIGGVEERLGKVEGRLATIEGDIHEIKTDIKQLLNGQR